MRASLDSALDLLQLESFPDLIPPESLPIVRRIARQLPPIYHGGFECRLGPETGLAGFHQRIDACDGQPAILVDHIAANRLGAHPAWRRIGDLAARCADPVSAFAEQICNVPLEIDVGPAAAGIPVPSLFVAFRSDVAPTGDRRRRLAGELLALLVEEDERPALLASLCACSDACPDGAAISHLGFMLGRRTGAIRVNVRGLPAAQIMPYLERVGWPGRGREIQEAVVRLHTLVHHVVLCLDVGARVGSKVGLECFLLDQPATEPRWAAFAGHLVDQRLCTVQQRDALLAWPGRITPEVAAMTWPADLISASLLQRPDLFGVFHRRLSHFKLSYQPGLPWQAKGYLEFHHSWAANRDV